LLERIVLANHKSAIKAIRTSERRRLRNRLVVTSTRTHIKRARITITGGNQSDAREAVVSAIRSLDKAVSKGILHKNNAARRKSRLMKRLNAMAKVG
jgi:small subunit ribosomal protein S20